MEAENASDEGNVCFVPAFTGLYAPHWKKEARGVICGLSGSTRPEHMVRAALEAVCHQVRSVSEAIAADCMPLKRLLADGGMAQNNYLMQTQADLLGIPVVRPLMSESTALGAAAAAGIALKVWPPSLPLPPSDVFQPSTTDDEREIRCAKWEQALERCLDWNVDPEEAKKQVDNKPKPTDPLSALPPSLFFLGTTLLIILADKIKSL